MGIARMLAGLILLLHFSVSLAAEQIVEGIITTVTPLEVKLLNGEVQSVVVSPGDPLPARLEKGQMLRLVYEVKSPEKKDDKGSIVMKDAKISGGTLRGTIVEIAGDKSWIVVRTLNPAKPDTEINVPLQVTDRFQALVTAMRAGDGVQSVYKRVTATGTDDTLPAIYKRSEPYVVQTLEWQRTAVTRALRWFSLGLAALGLFVVAVLFTKGSPTKLYLGADNRYSSSKFQVVLWFWVVVSAYLAILYHRISAAGWSYVGGVDIPMNLLILSGISVLTFASAKLITVGKVEQSAAQGEPGKQRADNPAAGDLIKDDLNRTDLGDYQMIVITILAVIVYAITVVEFMQYIEYRRVVTMPEVDATLLALFGLGQAAYLGKKAAGDAPAFDPAVKSVSSSADSAKEAAAKAEAAAQTAATAEAEAKRAAGAVAAAATKVAADPEAAKAVSAASAAVEAKALATVALQAAESQVAAAKKLADAWSKDVDGAKAIAPLFAAATGDLAKARSAAARAATSSDNAAASAKAAQDAAALKS